MALSILHLDDNSLDALAVQRHLSRSRPDWTVTWVSGRAAFEQAVAREAFDVILCDFRMPDWNGDQVLHYVLTHHPHTPFIMLTGELGEDWALEKIARGATDYVLKGSLGRLVPAVERAVRQASDEAERRRNLERLKEREEHYRILFENSPLPKWIFDEATLGFVDVNPRAVEKFGYSREELRAMRSWDLWAPEDGAVFQAHLERLPSTRHESFQARYRTRDGSLIEAEVSWSLMDLKGRRVCLSIVTDVTELVALKNRLSRELTDMQRLHDLSTRLFDDGDLGSMLQRVLEACLQLLAAEKGTVQVYDDVADALAIKGHVGFRQDTLEQFRYVSAGQLSPCGQAFGRRERVIVEDVFRPGQSEELHDPYRKEGLSASVSTPLFGRDGRIIGMLTAHYARPHRPSDRELRMLDLYVQQAERIIEYKQEAF